MPESLCPAGERNAVQAGKAGRGMRVQVLASVMNQSFEAIVSRMRLESDAVIINQCDRLDMEEREENGRRLRFYSFPDRGVGRSRNEAILRADGDICLFPTEILCMSQAMPTRL